MSELDSGEATSLTLEELPDSILLELFSYLPSQSVTAVAHTCYRLRQIAYDELLWKGLFRRDFKIHPSIPLHPGATSWLDEYRRLSDESPSSLYKEIKVHKDQVLHVSFSHNGTMFATSSKDGKILVWSADTCDMKFSANLTKEFNWRYTQFSQFNKSDTLLLVSGVHHGNNTTSGEITVFDLQEFEPQCRISNKPYDVFGTWYDDLHLFSGSLYWTGHLQSISALWLNKASQETESERESVLLNVYRFSNVSASSIRTIMVAQVPVLSQDTAAGSSDSPASVCSHCGLLLSSPLFADSQCWERNSGIRFRPFFANDVDRESTEQDMEEGDEEDWVMVNSAVNSSSNAVNLVQPDRLGGSDEELETCLSKAGAQKEPEEMKIVEDDPGVAGEGSGTVRCRVGAPFSTTDAGDGNRAEESLPQGLRSFKLCCCHSSKASSPKSFSKRVDRNSAGQKTNKSTGLSAESSTLSSDSGTMLCANSSSSSTLHNNPTHSGLKHASDIPRTSCTGRQTQSLPTEKLLIFTMGEETYTPHVIGFKRIRLSDIRGKESESYADPRHLLPDVDRNNQGNDRPDTDVDHTINMHGHIIGMALSPDQRYLYVNCRQWPINYHIENVLEPPPIASEIDIHVIDLVTFEEVGRVMTSHKAFTPNDECFFLFLDVSDQYVASGAEDRRGYLWDRHYGVHLRCFAHSDVVNSVAFNPRHQEMLVTVSDDNSIKVWRSRRHMRELRRQGDCAAVERWAEQHVT